MFVFLAFRNITRNKKDSAIIAMLIAVITFLFFVGNSVIGRADRNIRRAFVESLTGDVVLQKAGDVTMNLFGANAPVIDEFFEIPVLPAYDAVMGLVSTETGIGGITSQVSGKAFLDLLGLREPVLLGGIDADSYFSLFPGIILEEGRLLRGGEYGAMITAERARRIEERTGQRPIVGMPLLFTSGGAAGFKIREVPLVGIFRYQNPGQFMNEIVLIDPQTVRVLNSIQVAGAVVAEDAGLDLLSIDSDDIFGDAFVAAGETGDVEFTAEFLRTYLRESGTGASDAPAGGDWNFIILRLKDGVSPVSFIPSLNAKIAPYGLVAVNWRIASGSSAILTLLVQALFNSGIFLVSVVGVIAVINILLISVFRRVREIGTLRAIGAPDGYVRSLIYCENFFLALVAGCVGVLCGFVFSRWVNSLGIRIPNDLIGSVLGGPLVQVEFLPRLAGVSVVVAVLLGLAATVYPVEAAVRIEPEVAVRRG